jgi:hypothetical protein
MSSYSDECNDDEDDIDSNDSFDMPKLRFTKKNEIKEIIV